MEPLDRETPTLELCLLGRGLADMADEIERCGRCHRTPLIGEKIYEFAAGELRCALCLDHEQTAPSSSHTVHGLAFGHSIRVIDRRGLTVAP